MQNEEHENELNVSNGLNFRLFNDGFKYEFNARRAAHFPAKVMPNYLYLGNVDTAKNRDLLKQHGINYIINVTNDLPNYFENDSDFHYLRIPVDDNYANNVAQYFPGTCFSWKKKVAWSDDKKRLSVDCFVKRNL